MIQALRTFATALAASLTLGACATQVSYFAGADHESINPALLNPEHLPPVPVRLEVSFWRNGLRIADADAELREEILRALDETTLLRVVDDPKVPALLEVLVDDIVNPTGAPRADYFMAGMAQGTTSLTRVTDRYEFKLRYLAESGQVRYAHDKHSIWVRIGSAPAPSLRGPYKTWQPAFRQVVDEVMLGFLRNIATDRDTPDSLLFVPQD